MLLALSRLQFVQFIQYDMLATISIIFLRINWPT